MKVLQLWWLLIDINASREILDNISVINTKKYDTDIFLSFSSRTSVWYCERLRHLQTKTILFLSISRNF